MRRLRRSRLCLVVLGLLLTAGCSLVPGPAPKGTPRPLPGDQLVFETQGFGGGLAPPFNLALTGPSLALYGDGRLIVYDEAADNLDVPIAYRLHRVEADRVAELVADAEAADLVKDRTDFGSPGITDAPVTRVQLHGSGGPQQVTIYAFAESVEGDLGWRQRRARTQLRAIVDRAYALSGNSAGEAYRPGQVRVVEPRVNAEVEPGPDWPGPDPTTFLEPAPSPGAGVGCGILDGADAERVCAAARVNPGGLWTVAGGTRQLAVTARLPGADGCEGW